MKRIIGLFVALFAWAGIALAAVNINSATKEQLETLDGIGPVKAQAIIDYRKKNGPFRTLEDLKKVDGIGDATFDKVRKDIMLSGTTRVDSPAKAEPKKEEPRKEKAAAEPKKAAAEPRKAEVKKEEPKKEKAAAAEPKKADRKEAREKDDKKAAKKDDDKKADKKAAKKDDDKKK